MIFLIFFDTSFGIDFGCVLASISVPFWEPFGFISMFFRDRFLDDFSMAFLTEFHPKYGPNLSGVMWGGDGWVVVGGPWGVSGVGVGVPGGGSWVGSHPGWYRDKALARHGASIRMSVYIRSV